MIMSEALELYLMQSNLSESSRYNINSQMRLVIGEIGDKAVAEVGFRDLLRYLSYRQAQGAKPKTINTIIGYLNSFFRWLVYQELLEDNPAAKLKKAKESPKPDNVRGISLEDYRKLLDYAKEQSARDWAFIAFLGGAGCRISAAASLRLSNLSLGAGEAIVHEPKTREWIKVYFDEITASILERWINQRPEPQRAHDFVFVSLHMPHQAMTANSLRVRMKNLCKAAQIAIWTPHAIRHRLLIEWGHNPDITIFDMQHKANHHDSKTTLRSYAPKQNPRLKDLSEKFSLVKQVLDTPPDKPYPALRIVPRPSKNDENI